MTSMAAVIPEDRLRAELLEDAFGVDCPHFKLPQINGNIERISAS
jgi:hypothetical protein